MIIYNNEWYPETDNQVPYFELFLVLCQLKSATVLRRYINFFMAIASYFLGISQKISMYVNVILKCA